MDTERAAGKTMMKSSSLRADSDRDLRCWSSAVIIGLGFAAAVMAVSLLLIPTLAPDGRWGVSGDIWMVTDAGRRVWNGAFGYIYDGTTGWTALPLSAVIIAPAVGLGDHLALVDGWPAAIPHPTMWLLIEPYSLLTGIFFLHAVRRLAWELGTRRRLWIVQVLGVAVVLAPAAQWGHFEDVIALTLVLHSIRAGLREELSKSALLVSVAVASKQWAVLIVPFLVFRAPKGFRVRTFLLSAGLPAALATFTLGVDWHDASGALFAPTLSLRDNPGHVSILASWFGSHSSFVGRNLAVATSPFLGWRARRWADPAAFLIVASVALTWRAILEPVTYSYYWSPGLLLVILAFTCDRSGAGWGPLSSAFCITAWTVPPSKADTRMKYILPTAKGNQWWWIGQLLVLIGGMYVLLVNQRVRRNCTTHTRLGREDARVEGLLSWLNQPARRGRYTAG